MRQASPPPTFSNPFYLVPLYEIRLVSRNALEWYCMFSQHSECQSSIYRQTLFFVVFPITEHTQFSCFVYTITKVILTFCNVSKKRDQESWWLLPGLEERCRFIHVHSTLVFRVFVNSRGCPKNTITSLGSFNG